MLCLELFRYGNHIYFQLEWIKSNWNSTRCEPYREKNSPLCSIEQSRESKNFNLTHAWNEAPTTGLTHQHCTRLERLARDKHSSLSPKFIDYSRKSFIAIPPGQSGRCRSQIREHLRACCRCWSSTSAPRSSSTSGCWTVADGGPVVNVINVVKVSGK